MVNRHCSIVAQVNKLHHFPKIGWADEPHYLILASPCGTCQVGCHFSSLRYATLPSVCQSYLHSFLSLRLDLSIWLLRRTISLDSLPLLVRNSCRRFVRIAISNPAYFSSGVTYLIEVDPMGEPHLLVGCILDGRKRR